MFLIISYFFIITKLIIIPIILALTYICIANQTFFFLKGNILRSEIDGCIQMRNFVAGCPEVKIALNEDFFVGKSDVVSRGKLTNPSLKEKIQCGSVILLLIVFVLIIIHQWVSSKVCHIPQEKITVHVYILLAKALKYHFLWNSSRDSFQAFFVVFFFGTQFIPLSKDIWGLTPNIPH